jgi:zinc-ribbon domain
MNFCGNCGEKLPQGVKFCPNCGASVETGTSPSDSTSVQVPTPMERRASMMKPIPVLVDMAYHVVIAGVEVYFGLLFFQFGSISGAVIGLVLLIAGVSAVFSAYGLFQRARWLRLTELLTGVLSVIMGFIFLITFNELLVSLGFGFVVLGIVAFIFPRTKQGKDYLRGGTLSSPT